MWSQLKLINVQTYHVLRVPLSVYFMGDDRGRWRKLRSRGNACAVKICVNDARLWWSVRKKRRQEKESWKQQHSRCCYFLRCVHLSRAVALWATCPIACSAAAALSSLMGVMPQGQKLQLQEYKEHQPVVLQLCNLEVEPICRWPPKTGEWEDWWCCCCCCELQRSAADCAAGISATTRSQTCKHLQSPLVLWFDLISVEKDEQDPWIDVKYNAELHDKKWK